MASSSRTLASDPLRSFKFNVVIPISTSNTGAPSQGMARLGFMSVSGLGLAIEPLTYREGGDNLTTRKMPGQADVNPVTLSRGLFYTDKDNWNWMQNLFTAIYGNAGGSNPGTVQIQGSQGVGTGPDFRTHVYINLLQHPNTTVAAASGGEYKATYPQQNSIVQISWKLYSAWISNLAYSDMDAGGNAVAVEQMTLNHEGLDMRWGGDYASGYVPNPTGW